MTLLEAQKQVFTCAEQMRARYNDKAVFDEWAIVELGRKHGRVLAYMGPRKEGFRQNFASDATALRTGLISGEHNIGDFEFSRHNVGTGFESYMVLGKDMYLICNNTVQSMDAIAKDPHWLNAQVPFVELSERFRQSPLQQEPTSIR